LTHP
jgi:hypothetical protein